ncbi:hypothetical protein BURPS305_1110 [Burkholderia pseudomallei 305]|nr:hypothetical protein BURPS305_1110 [Burkholderia pseudomallei 305]
MGMKACATARADGLPGTIRGGARRVAKRIRVRHPCDG